MKLKKYLRTIALVVGLAGGSQAHAGIPVVDGMHIAESIQEQIETIAQWAEQYAQMVLTIQQLEQQYNQAVTQYNSMTGSRGMSSLLNSAGLKEARRLLPDDAQAAFDLANGAAGTYSGIANDITAIKNSVSSLSNDSFTSGTAARQWKDSLNRVASTKALSKKAYNAAAQRLQNLEDLTDQISATDDPKAIAELQARIATEQGMVQNEQAKLQALSMLMASEQQVADQQARELSIKTGSVASIPRVSVTP